MIRALLFIAGLGVASCSVVPATPPPPTAGMVETIRYETQQCFGVCPVYVVTVSSDGRGVFEGTRNTAVTGSREFAVSRKQYAEFSRRLAPYRPAGDRRIAEPNCNGSIAIDLPSVEIRWSGKGPSSSLYANYGCDMDGNATMFEALQNAPEALPIEEFIGQPLR